MPDAEVLSLNGRHDPAARTPELFTPRRPILHAPPESRPSLSPVPRRPPRPHASHSHAFSPASPVNLPHAAARSYSPPTPANRPSASLGRSPNPPPLRHMSLRRSPRVIPDQSALTPSVMSTNENLTHKWLRQNTQTYSHRDSVFHHVDAVLARYPTIRPKTDVYTYDDGRTKLLLCLHGLLPIAFRGASYNIPVAIWLTREYPQEPPIAYVVPTSDMLVRPGPDMDVSGRCQTEYLRNWGKKPEGCSLSILLEAMRDTFSRLPPVYSKPAPAATKPATPPRPPAGPDYSARPPPPVPGAHVPAPSQAASPIPVTHGDTPPPLPAKPGTPTAGPSAVSISRTPSVQSPAPALSYSQSFGGSENTTAGVRHSTPFPPQPPIPSGVSSIASSPVPPVYTPHARPIDATAAPLSRPASMQVSGGNVPMDQQATYVPPRPSYPTIPPTQSPPPIPPHPVPASSPLAHGLPQGNYGSPLSPTGNVQPDAPPSALPPPFVSPQPTANIGPQPYHQQRAAPIPPSAPAPPPPAPPPARPNPPPDLLDAEDLSTGAGSSTPPPGPSAFAPRRPPNPELLRLQEEVRARLRSELASLREAMAVDAERLRAHQADLLAGGPAIRDEMARLEAVRDVCRTAAERMRGVVGAGARSVAELRRKGDPEVDELVCSTTIVHNQLINLVAEDNAIEDTIYHLHRALNSGRIDLEKFIRTTRGLAEEQFMKRALIEKIQAGLPPGDAAIGWTMPTEW